MLFRQNGLAVGISCRGLILLCGLIPINRDTCDDDDWVGNLHGDSRSGGFFAIKLRGCFNCGGTIANERRIHGYSSVIGNGNDIGLLGAPSDAFVSQNLGKNRGG